MAMIYVDLSANGTQLDGEPTMTDIAGVDVSSMLEALSFYHEATTGQDESGAVRATTHRKHSPMTIVKRVDKASPQLMQAWAQNQTIEATYKFFRRNADSGAMEHFYSIVGTGGRVLSIREESANALYGDGQGDMLLERVSIIFNTMTWTHETESREYMDNWGQDSIT